MPRNKNKKLKLSKFGIPKLTIIKKFTPNTIKQISLLLKNCWEYPVHIPTGRWFLIKKGRNILAAGQLDEQNTLWNLCTDKKYRGKGYAKRIIHTMLNKICREKGIMSLFVNSSSPKSWYERLGFEAIMMNEREKIKYIHYPDVEKMSRHACDFKQRNSFSFGTNNSFCDNGNAPTPGPNPDTPGQESCPGVANPFPFRMEKHLQDLYKEKFGYRDAAIQRVTDDSALIHNISQFLGGFLIIHSSLYNSGKEA